MVIAQSDQAMHLMIKHKESGKCIYCSIYASNSQFVRHDLWAELGLHKNVVRNTPWILIGDFNVALNLDDVHSGASSISASVFEFKDCVENIEVDGHNMYKVVKKMKDLKKLLRKLLHDLGNLHERVQNLRVELDTVQKDLDARPDDPILRDEEAVYLKAFNEPKLDEERFLKQKAKIEWLEVGDTNSAYFHKSVKSKNQRIRMDVIRNSANEVVTGNSCNNPYF
ncbi:3-ketoacyl-CoA synthase 11-like protein [Tanacetum coccineum]